MRTRTIRLPDDYDFAATVGPLQHGLDPTTRVAGSVLWRTMKTPDGPATIQCERVDQGVRATAWGPGAEAALESAPALVGALDEPSAYRPRHPLLRELQRRFRGVHFPRTGAIFHALVPAVLEQKVTGREAGDSWRALVNRFGANAAGPGGFLLPPEPSVLRDLPYFALHPLGIERRRADTLRRAAARAGRLEATASISAEDARRALRVIRGIGEWTAAEVTRVTHGDPDAVSVGDFHLPHLVTWALASEARGTDARMLDLLEGETPHRARAVRLLELSGIRQPRFGPRRRLRSIAQI